RPSFRFRPRSCFCRRAGRYAPSFPTRRSSDLGDDFTDPVGSLRKAVDLGVALLRLCGCALHEGGRLGDLARYFLDGRRQFVAGRSEEHTSELQSHLNLVCRLLLEKKEQQNYEC